MKYIIKNIPISAFKVSHKLKTFGCLALPDVELYEDENCEADDISVCEEEFSNTIDAHTTVKSDGQTFKFVKLRKRMDKMVEAENGVQKKKRQQKSDRNKSKQ
jgi:hypothetical protein